MEFIAQPFAHVRLGDFLLGHLGDRQWTSFRAAIAFVKRSGTSLIHRQLSDFGGWADIGLSVGVDFNGTSKEGLGDLLDATPNGSVFVYQNHPSTFHPKVYVFKSGRRADVLVGSGNLTRGGLYTNYEASLVASLDLSVAGDLEFLLTIERELDAWSRPVEGLCRRLTPDLLEDLAVRGLALTEAAMRSIRRAGYTPAQAASALPPLFVPRPVPPPPNQAETAHEAEPEPLWRDPVTAAPLYGGGLDRFAMTLQNTDVGTGQTTPGTSRRSPEVFVPLGALDQNEAFWGFPDSFAPDAEWDAGHPGDRRGGRGKMDRERVRMRIGTIQSVSMFFNPRKRDFRLRNEHLRSAGAIGDILLISRVDPLCGFEYDIQVAPQGTLLFDQLAPHCNTAVDNSKKRFGYF